MSIICDRCGKASDGRHIVTLKPQDAIDGVSGQALLWIHRGQPLRYDEKTSVVPVTLHAVAAPD